MMDDHSLVQFVDLIKKALSFPQVEMHLGNISNQLETLADNSKRTTAVQRETLATEALNALAAENARLVKLLSEREVAMGELRIEHERVMGQMRAFLQDLSGACIGCKKLSWRPHKADCDWSASAEKLQEMFSEPNRLNPG